MRAASTSPNGFTLIELLLALSIAGVLMAALTGLVGRVFDARDDSENLNSATREARFAMQRMVTAVRNGDRLLVPLADNPASNWRENVREQSFPAQPPEGDSLLATAVLAVTLGHFLDRDEDGFADADNDKDGRVDEDLFADNSNDSRAGIVGIDDDGDGIVDEGGASGRWDNDEDGADGEDWFDGIDNDGDGSVDEDTSDDMNNDGEPGVSGVDDDGDGSVDEGSGLNDDEDGSLDEDWLDPVVFFLDGSTLMERLPDLNPSWGGDFSEYPLATDVTYFRVERVPGVRSDLVDITLELTPPGGDPARLTTRVRIGGAQ